MITGTLRLVLERSVPLVLIAGLYLFLILV